MSVKVKAKQFGSPCSGRLGIPHGVFKSMKYHWCELTAGGDFLWFKGRDADSEEMDRLRLKDILSVGPVNEDDAPVPSGRRMTFAGRAVSVNGRRLTISVDPNKFSHEFVIISTRGTFNFIAQSLTDMNAWIAVLNPPRAANSEGVCGWLKLNKDKKRWFVLRKGSIVYYKSVDDSDPCGAIPLDALCTIVVSPVPGDHAFTVHSALQSVNLASKAKTDVDRWLSAIQDVIETTVVSKTPTEELLHELRVKTSEEIWEAVQSNEVLRYSELPISQPLLGLPYGDIIVRTHSHNYRTMQLEAVDVFASLTPDGSPRYGSPAKEYEWIKSIVQLCIDVPSMRNEVYCQILKQLCLPPVTNMEHWKLFGALCLIAPPSQKYFDFFCNRLRAIRTHAMSKKGGEITIASEDLMLGAVDYCLEMLQKVRMSPPTPVEIDLIFSGRAFKRNVEGVIIDSPEGASNV